MRKTLYTLNIDNYAPEIVALTYPLMYRVARKLAWQFHVISERRFKEWPVAYEKLQIYTLMQERGDAWAWFLDGDALVHPDMFDPTDHIGRDTVCFHGIDMAGNRWRYDEYMRRSGRHVGACNWNAMASSWCRDLWHPLDLTLPEALERIYPIQNEITCPALITREHLIDDYALSRNVARFGLKVTTIAAICKDLGDQGSYFWHQYTRTVHEKVHGWNDPREVTPQNPDGHVAGMLEVLKAWGV